MLLPALSAGLCETCIERRLIETGRSVFVLCERGLTDPSYPKYPLLPVRRCAGYAPIGSPPHPANG